MPGPEILPAIYDGFAQTYEANRDSFDLSEVLAEFQALLPESGHLLDLGCGAGGGAASAFLASGWRVTGVDFSPGMLALAERLAPGMRTVLGDMRAVDFPEGSFEAVAAVYSLFHLPKEDHAPLLAALRRWLKPGGRLLFTYASEAYTGCPSFSGCKEFLGQRLYYSHLDPEALRMALEAAGLVLEDLRSRTIGGETFLWVRAARP